MLLCMYYSRLSREGKYAFKKAVVTKANVSPHTFDSWISLMRHPRHLREAGKLIEQLTDGKVLTMDLLRSHTDYVEWRNKKRKRRKNSKLKIK